MVLFFPGYSIPRVGGKGARYAAALYFKYGIGTAFFFHGTDNSRYALAFRLRKLEFVKQIRKTLIAPFWTGFAGYKFFFVNAPMQVSRGSYFYPVQKDGNADWFGNFIIPVYNGVYQRFL
jgi:hypothetical protein